MAGQSDIQALDWATSNFDDPRAEKIFSINGISEPRDRQAYRWAKKNPKDERSSKILEHLGFLTVPKEVGKTTVLPGVEVEAKRGTPISVEDLDKPEIQRELSRLPQETSRAEEYTGPTTGLYGGKPSPVPLEAVPKLVSKNLETSLTSQPIFQAGKRLAEFTLRDVPELLKVLGKQPGTGTMDDINTVLKAISALPEIPMEAILSGTLGGTAYHVAGKTLEEVAPVTAQRVEQSLTPLETMSKMRGGAWLQKSPEALRKLGDTVFQLGLFGIFHDVMTKPDLYKPEVVEKVKNNFIDQVNKRYSKEELYEIYRKDHIGQASDVEHKLVQTLNTAFPKQSGEVIKKGVEEISRKDLTPIEETAKRYEGQQPSQEMVRDILRTKPEETTAYRIPETDIVAYLKDKYPNVSRAIEFKVANGQPLSSGERNVVNKAKEELTEQRKTDEIKETTGGIPEYQFAITVPTETRQIKDVLAEHDEQFQKYTDFNDQVTERIKALQEQAKGLPKRDPARKDIKASIENLQTALGDNEVKFMDATMERQNKSADAVLEYAKNKGLTFERDSDRDEFLNEALLSISGERPYVEYNWERPVNEVLDEVIDRTKEMQSEAEQPQKENIPIKGTKEATEKGKELQGKPEEIKALWEQAKAERSELNKVPQAQRDKAFEVRRHNTAMKEEVVMSALGASESQSFTPQQIEEKISKVTKPKSKPLSELQFGESFRFKDGGNLHMLVAKEGKNRLRVIDEKGNESTVPYLTTIIPSNEVLQVRKSQEKLPTKGAKQTIIISAKAVKSELQKNFNIPEDQAGAASIIADARATQWAKENNSTKEEWYKKIAGVRSGITPGEGALRQEAEKVTNTPEFKKWFGESKVVDEKGEPLVVYHGSREPIETFSKEKQTDLSSIAQFQGFHFGNEEQAKMRNAKNVTPVYLKAERIKRVKDDGGNWNSKVRIAKSGGYDGIIYLNRFEGIPRTEYDKAEQSGVKTDIEGLDRMSDSEFQKHFPSASDSYIVFEPNQIKSATGNRGTFDPNNPNILYQGEPSRYYSRTEQLLQSKLPNVTTVEQARNILKSAPQDEVKWTGLDDFLSKKSGKVSKQEILDYLKQNQVEIKEVMKDDAEVRDDLNHLEDLLATAHGRKDEIVREIGASGGVWVTGRPLKWVYQSEPAGEVKSVPRKYIAELDELSKRIMTLESAIADYDDEHVSSESATKYSQYVLPGAEEGSYRELLLTMPEKPTGEIRNSGWTAQYTRDIGESREYYVFDENKKFVDSLIAESKDDAINKATLSKQERQQRGKRFQSGHFDEPNVLAHVRFDDRTDAQGKKVLFIEELQSDWAQKGRKTGFKGETKYSIVQNENGTYGIERRGSGVRGEYKTRQEAERAAEPALLGEQEEQVPNMPFKTTWHELALRRILQYAAENGYEKLSWTTGEQQAERYDLSKQIDRLNVVEQHFEGFPGDGKGYRVTANKDGNTVISKDVTPQELPNLIGKEMADRALQMIEKNKKRPVPKYSAEMSGLDLKVGGEGMRGFYDRIIPQYLDKFGKKFGAKAGETEIKTAQPTILKRNGLYRLESPEGDIIYQNADKSKVADFVKTHPEQFGRNTVHSLDISPSMRESVTKGIPLFQDKKGAVEFLKDNRAIIYALKGADISTIVHELGHVFRRDLAPDDLKIAEEWAGVKEGKWENKHEEKFARGFERYMRDGEAPTEKLKAVFQKFKEWLTNIYRAIKGSSIDVDLSPKIKAVFDRMLGGEEKPKPLTTEKIVEATEVTKESSGTLSSTIVPGLSPQMLSKAYSKLATASSDVVKQAKRSLGALSSDVEEAKQSMLEHHREIRDASFLKWELKHAGERIYKTYDIKPDRQTVLMHALQNEQKYIKQLDPTEKAIYEVAKRERDRLQDMALAAGFVDPDLIHNNPQYLYQWWKNPKTGEPFSPFYSRLARSAPQEHKKFYQSYEEGIKAGLEPASTNIFELIGLGYEGVARANASRTMLQALAGIESIDPRQIKRSPSGTPKPMRVIERWSKLKEQGLDDGYTRYHHPVLDKRLAIQLPNGLVMSFQGAIGIKDELYPFVRDYVESPNYGKLSRLMFAAKTLKLMSGFHVFSLQFQAFAGSPFMAKIPILNVFNGLRTIKEGGENLRLLYRNGLDVKGYADTGNYESALQGPGVIKKALRATSDFTFNVVHPGIKVYSTMLDFERLISEQEEKTGKQLNDEQKNAIAQKVVTFNNALFSGEDYRTALLLSNEWMARNWYSPEARKKWQNILLSPTWQKEHLQMAKDAFKAFTTGRKDLDAHLYRRYIWGALSIYATANLYNWVMTKRMDGKGKFMIQNPNAFTVRMPWNTSDDHKVYAHPLKSIFEIPEFLSDPAGKAISKLAPFYQAMGDLYKDIKDRQSPLHIAGKAITDVAAPIFANQLFDTETPLQDKVLSAVGLPSRQYIDPWEKKMQDKLNERGRFIPSDEKADEAKLKAKIEKDLRAGELPDDKDLEEMEKNGWINHDGVMSDKFRKSLTERMSYRPAERKFRMLNMTEAMDVFEEMPEDVQDQFYPLMEAKIQKANDDEVFDLYEQMSPDMQELFYPLIEQKLPDIKLEQHEPAR